MINIKSCFAPDREYAHGLVERLPEEWQRPLIMEWLHKARPRHLWAIHSKTHVEIVRRDANVWLTELMEDIAGGARGSMLGYSDSEIIGAAEESAERCRDILRRFGFTENALSAMLRYSLRRGVGLPSGDTTRIKLRRYACAFFWRRQLRKVASRSTESVAQQLGWISKNSGSYVSHIALQRRQAQIARNNKTLESIKMFDSVDGTCTNLLKIAEHTLSNKTIRRGELMLRARGFEEVARELGHAALFVTITCPSRFHSMRLAEDGRAEKNPAWDKSTPKQAQEYLVKTWAKIRAALARRGRTLYGIRVAEPHHDGCPHWHMLVFLPENPDEDSSLTIYDVMLLMKEYALQDSPDEPGAWKRRVDFVRIQPDEGSAAGYIAKYLAKNLDGAHIEQDLFGNPALIAARRVDAWASTWGIRQFQQLGGAPVTVWRELRRCRVADCQGAPDHLADAIQAVNTEKVIQDAGRASWSEYIKSQGGPTIGRRARIRLWKKDQAGFGQYGEPLPQRIEGITTTYIEHERFGIIPSWPVVKQFFLKSARKIWVRYKTFDIDNLLEYVARIVKRRSTEPGGNENASKRTQDQICTLPHDGNNSKPADSSGAGGAADRALSRNEPQRNPRRAYLRLLRLHCGAA